MLTTLIDERGNRLGMPFPELTANFIGVLEIGGGLLLIFGLFTRFIAFVFIGEMIVAILSTKILYIWELLRCPCRLRRRKSDFGRFCTRYVRITRKF